MHIKRKIVLDRTIGAGIALAVNIVALIAGRVLNRQHGIPKCYRRIVVFKLIGMGSIVQATPFLRSIKISNPGSRLYFVSTLANKELLKKISSVDSILTIDDSSVFSLIFSTLCLLVRFRAIRPDCAVDLENYAHFSSILAVCSCARYRFGFFKRTIGTRNGIFTHLAYFNIKAPISRVYLQLADIAGCSVLSEETELLLPSAGEEESLKKTCCDAGIVLTTPYIVINPNASELRIERRWSSENFAALASLLLDYDSRSNLVFVGSQSEQQYVGELLAKIPGQHSRVYNLAGKLSIAEMLALLYSAQLLVTNDSGPLHFAAALKKKVVALFGPCSPRQYGVMPGVFVIYKNVYCSPCVHEFNFPPCGGDNACMKAISVDDVFKTVTMSLHQTAPDTAYEKIIYRHSQSQQPLGIVKRIR